MLTTSGANTPGHDQPPPERLPNYLLSSSTTPGATRSPAHPNFPYNPSTPGLLKAPNSSPIANHDALGTPQWPFAARRQGQPVAFNDRLRASDPTIAGQPSPKDALPPTAATGTRSTGGAAFPRAADASPGGPRRTPARMPPNKSLLDSGPPSVLTLRSPSASPAAASLTMTPASRAVRTPGSASPAAPGLELWVTVFGFAPAMESQVLREFRRHGEIVRTVPGRGNWVHVLYRTPLQAQVALYKPWRVLAGTETMVGTVPCTEPHVAREADEAIQKGILVASPSAVPSPYTKAGSFSAVRSPSPAHPALRTPASILRRDQGGMAGGAQSIVRTPQKQTGILDYISGFYK